jgi:nucleoside-diphosphate-sugar epimerase
LITGICGFTGAYVAAELEEAGYRVVGLTHRAHTRTDWLTVDLLDRTALETAIAEIEPEVVVHLAAIAFVAHGDADAIYRTNIVGTRNLLQVLSEVQKRPRAVVLASSANIYGNAGVEIIDEEVPPAPRNDYAVSKLAMEHMARLWGERLPILFTRPFNYTGVGQSIDYVLPKIVDHFRRREPVVELGNLEVSRDFWDVRSVAQAYRRLVETVPVGETFNVCSGRAYSLREAIVFLESLAGYRIEVRVNPAFVRANEVKRLTGSNAKLLSRVGPLRDYSLQETLEWMYRA